MVLKAGTTTRPTTDHEHLMLAGHVGDLEAQERHRLQWRKPLHSVSTQTDREGRACMEASRALERGFGWSVCGARKVGFE